MLIGEIIQRITSLYSKGAPSDDSRLAPRHVYNKMLTVRGKLIYQKANKNQKISAWNYQTLPCIEMVVAQPSECPCLPPSGCQILKTKYKLPKPLTGLSTHLIKDVTSIDGTVIYSEIGWDGYKYKKGNKYTAHKPDYFIRDGYLYITHKSGPKIITLSGLFEDPYDASHYPSFCDEDCKDCQDCDDAQKKEFPLDGEMLDLLVEICVAALVSMFGQINQDLTNNSKDDVQEPQ